MAEDEDDEATQHGIKGNSRWSYGVLVASVSSGCTRNRGEPNVDPSDGGVHDGSRADRGSGLGCWSWRRSRRYAGRIWCKVIKAICRELRYRAKWCGRFCGQRRRSFNGSRTPKSPMVHVSPQPRIGRAALVSPVAERAKGVLPARARVWLRFGWVTARPRRAQQGTSSVHVECSLQSVGLHGR
jgi:hypothetical protein